MRVLITGADGMLGSNLVRLLIERGHTVSVLIHPSSRSLTLENLRITKYLGDILKPGTLISAVAGNDVVIHAAASTRIWPARSETVRRINIEGTRNIIEAAIKCNIKRFIYIGSGASVKMNGDSSGRHISPGPGYGLDYIESKHEALKLVMDAVASRGLPALAILPTFMIGPYDSLPGSGRMIQAYARGKIRFHTSGGKNFIHVMDVATAIANSLEMGRIGAYYITGNENMTYRTFFKKVAMATGRPETKILVPDWLMKTFGWFGTVSGKMLNREPLLTYQAAKLACVRQYVDDDSAVEELGMPRTDIDTAIRECYDWFLENGYLNHHKKRMQ